MAKSAQTRLNEFFDETDVTRRTVKAFSDAAYDHYGSHSYACGWLESSVVNLIMQLPKAKREAARREFVEAALKQRKAAAEAVS